MRLLYLSCHSVLEYDEVKLFTELGIDVFSPGAYVCPQNPGDNSMRPPLESLEYDPVDVQMWHDLGAPNKERLTKEFVDRFDAVMIMHIPDWVSVNWEAMKHKIVIWRTIGQALPHQELMLQKYRKQGMRVVRYSPRERVLKHYCGEDAVIRFYKDPEEFKEWSGHNKRIITICQAMKERRTHCCYDIFMQITEPFDRALFGPKNEDAGEVAKGTLSFDELKAELRSNRAYFAPGTHPASYTLNFIEAWMTGIPVLAVGPYHGNAPFHSRPAKVGDPDHNCLYEVPDLIMHGHSGFCTDHLAELQDAIKQLLDNYDLARQISTTGRRMAIAHFGKEGIKQQWSDFFKTL